jgi:hypothetical protein
MIRLFGRIGRPYFVLLAIFTAARWLQGNAFGVPYERGTWLFSIVILTIMASLFSTAYTRRWLGWGLGRAVLFTMFIALTAQIVILLSTAASYGLGLSTYFNNPIALNQQQPVGMGQALGIRLGGLVVNTLVNGIAGALGWALGGLLPAAPDAQR